MTISIDVVRQFAPLIYFHTNERFFPCSIEYLLQGATLNDRNAGQSLANPTQGMLAANSGENWYVKINPSQYGGQGTSAPIYYAVQGFESYIDINYIVLYAYQGGQTCRALRAGTPFNCIVETLGIHQGDLERIAVRIAKGADGSYRAVQVEYEAHGNKRVYPTDRVRWEGSHPVAHAALNGHSFWNTFDAAVGDRYDELTIPGVVSVTSALADGPVWRPSDFRKLEMKGGLPQGDQLWAAFKGRLGDQQTNSLESATYFDGSNLSSWDWAFVKIVNFGAVVGGQYSDDIRKGNGPGGPGGRDWVESPPTAGMIYVQARGQMGEGAGAVAWLRGPFTRPDRDQIVQCWDNGSRLGVIVYGADGSGGLRELWGSADMGAGAGAVSWLVGDFNGDGRREIAQCWSNDSRLGMIVYGSDGGAGLKTLWANADMGQGMGAVSWQVGDYNGDGKDEIVQCWENSNKLGMIVYGSDGGAGLKTIWGTDDLGEGPGAVRWLVGDINGDGRDEIVQCWGNGSKLGMIVYGADGSGGLRELWGSADMGQGVGAVSWLVGDFNGDGRREIAQCWGNDSKLAMIVYGSDGGAGLKTLWATADMGQGVGAVSWQVGDYNGDGKDEIVQCWGNGNKLGMIVYGSDGGAGLKTIWESDDLGEGPAAVMWMTGRYLGVQKKQIMQGWDNGSRLGLSMYGMQ